ncbi:serine hydrolase domain-containing protein [Ascidiimonas aurantiaca]|uniref:serine hydrolase domain-containing protein n=1 Tax=Ascidiimonas aurantiaca TaxID=1685432 RepID=UPI0030EB6E15
MKQIIVFLLILITSCKQTEKIRLSQETIEKVVNQEVSDFMRSPYAAVSGAVYVNGTTYQFHFGKLTDGKQANNQTIYDIGSITKTYTGLMLAQAVSDKKLSLEKDIRIYLDDTYSNLELDYGKPITLRHLITHNSGLPMNINCNNENATIDEQISCFDKFTKAKFFEALKKVNLIDRSGKNYHYSNAGVQLVGYILEDTYQMSFQELLKQYVFARSGEQDTKPEINRVMSSRIAIGKDSNGKIMPLTKRFYQYAGGLKSSTNSMLDYIKIYLINNDSITKESMRLLAGNAQHGRAYAWNTYNYDEAKKMLYHSGGTFGQSSWIALYPKQNIGIFLVTNVSTDNSQGDLNGLSNRIIGKLID